MRTSLVAVLAAATLSVPLLAASPAAAERPRRGIVADIFEVGHTDRFVIRGRFKQPYEGRRIMVQHRLNGGRWQPYTTVATTPQSRYRIRVVPRGRTGDVVCYRLVVRGDRHFRRARVLKASRGRHAGQRFCLETLFG